MIVSGNVVVTRFFTVLRDTLVIVSRLVTVFGFRLMIESIVRVSYPVVVIVSVSCTTLTLVLIDSTVIGWILIITSVIRTVSTDVVSNVDGTVAVVVFCFLTVFVDTLVSTIVLAGKVLAFTLVLVVVTG